MLDVDENRKQKIKELFNELDLNFSSQDEARLEKLELIVEAAYDIMYEAYDPNYFYYIARDTIEDAIGLAYQLGKADDAQRLLQRRQHIKVVFRSQLGY